MTSDNVVIVDRRRASVDLLYAMATSLSLSWSLRLRDTPLTLLHLSKNEFMLFYCKHDTSLAKPDVSCLYYCYYYIVWSLLEGLIRSTQTLLHPFHSNFLSSRFTKPNPYVLLSLTNCCSTCASAFSGLHAPFVETHILIESLSFPLPLITNNLAADICLSTYVLLFFFC